tara:strand:- start:47249 stop:47965 length:717 start_codon:yes stop_codon:yes gene_type:complete
MKIPFWATVLTLICVIILCSLGAWQIKRLAWKQTLLSRIQAEYGLDSASVELDPGLDLSGILLKRGYLEGVYMHDKALMIQARTYKGHPGYHLITPFKMANFEGKVVFVNRGWVPLGIGATDDLIQKPKGLIRITGMLRQVPKSNSFVPQNMQDQWYRIEPEEFARAKGVDAYYTNIFYKENRQDVRGTPTLPIAVGSTIQVHNNHAGYALFWFVMAMAMVVVYILRFLAPQFRKKFK